MDYYEVEQPMPYCPRCEAPWVEEHEIQVAPERPDDPEPLYWIQRQGGPTADCPEGDDDVLGYSRSQAEQRLSELADADSCQGLWRKYGLRHRNRELLDVLADRRRRER